VSSKGQVCPPGPSVGRSILALDTIGVNILCHVGACHVLLVHAHVGTDVGSNPVESSTTSHSVSSLAQVVFPLCPCAPVCPAFQHLIPGRQAPDIPSFTGHPPSRTFPLRLCSRLHLSLFALSFNVPLLVVICVIGSQSETLGMRQGWGSYREQWGSDGDNERGGGGSMGRVLGTNEGQSWWQ
jgi:hypothetical protein